MLGQNGDEFGCGLSYDSRRLSFSCGSAVLAAVGVVANGG